MGYKIQKLSKEWLVLVILAILVFGIGIIEWNKNSSIPIQTISETVQNPQRMEKEEGNVTVIIEFLPDKSISQLSFRIVLDTHTVDLDNFDFGKSIVLEKDGKEISPLVVDTQGSGHHRSAEIVFFQKADFPFTIAVKNLASIQRREFKFTN